MRSLRHRGRAEAKEMDGWDPIDLAPSRFTSSFFPSLFSMFSLLPKPTCLQPPSTLPFLAPSSLSVQSSSFSVSSLPQPKGAAEAGRGGFNPQHSENTRQRADGDINWGRCDWSILVYTRKPEGCENSHPTCARVLLHHRVKAVMMMAMYASMRRVSLYIRASVPATRSQVVVAFGVAFRLKRRGGLGARVEAPPPPGEASQRSAEPGPDGQRHAAIALVIVAVAVVPVQRRGVIAGPIDQLRSQHEPMM